MKLKKKSGSERFKYTNITYFTSGLFYGCLECIVVVYFGPLCDHSTLLIILYSSDHFKLFDQARVLVIWLFNSI
ncbi:hypothetical protein DERF_000170 [Dermatophagoides farinae]|uniref:Uncharacterized protein n=1 Tax=Dermatophagoides farinae TaxID=6954 RepID=A0A922I840_DERFA|nr:hypothetical protein DERF_000170 [Dermatophagoides farinae]